MEWLRYTKQNYSQNHTGILQKKTSKTTLKDTIEKVT